MICSDLTRTFVITRWWQHLFETETYKETRWTIPGTQCLPAAFSGRKRSDRPDDISQKKPWPHSPITTALLQVVPTGVSTPGKGSANFIIMAGIKNLWLIY